MQARREVARRFVVGSFTAALVLGGATGGMAAGAPPPNPTDAELDAGRLARDDAAAKVGELTNELAAAEVRLIELQADVELKAEDANKALVDLDAAAEAARRAADDAVAARREADLANGAIRDARRAVDEFAAASFRQGTTVGSMSAYLGASSPGDLLARAGLLNAVSGSTLDAVESLERSRVDKANKDSLARAALERADALRAAAEQAKRDAEAARAAAEQAQREQAGKAAELEAAKADLERRLVEAQARVGGLEAQRRRYQDWLAAKQRADEERAKQAMAAQESDGEEGAGGSDAGSGPSGAAGVRTAIKRALSQLGVSYAWGGGNANGPTRGTRDGGTADAFGDYRKVGFDCSGLMIYAFAGAGVRLPHYSGYQARAGRSVPLSQVRPGDLLFWQRGGRIHHVALYLGNGQMVEAPHSGARVRVTSVRYGGIVPRATRLF